MNKIQMIESSLRCLTWGWLSLIPLAGLGFGILAIRNFTRAWYHLDGDWNPAKWHLYGGAFLALLSFLVHALILTFPVIYMLSNQ
jgi:hypothetical protein